MMASWEDHARGISVLILGAIWFVFQFIKNFLIHSKYKVIGHLLKVQNPDGSSGCSHGRLVRLKALTEWVKGWIWNREAHPHWPRAHSIPEEALWKRCHLAKTMELLKFHKRWNQVMNGTVLPTKPRPMEGAEILEEAQSHQWPLLVLSSPDTGTEH